MPTKTGVVTDALGVFDHVKKHSKNSSVVVYGHSLGTAVSCEAVNILCNTNKPPDALILESPFNNIHEEVC
jgi:abhydrolase domain-containing protein 12